MSPSHQIKGNTSYLHFSSITFRGRFSLSPPQVRQTSVLYILPVKTKFLVYSPPTENEETLYQSISDACQAIRDHPETLKEFSDSSGGHVEHDA